MPPLWLNRERRMTERPILFSGPMVRALLAGTKTQTRRVVKLRHGADVVVVNGQVWKPARVDYAGYVDCPYGQPGDRLWVRETFCPIYPQDPHYNGGRPIEYDYAATYQHGSRLGDLIGEKKKWKPSIHMPRIASRILLEITAVRVERLHDISEADALAEGIETMREHDRCARPTGRILGLGHPRGEPPYWMRPVQAYALLWESINGPGSWDANPWVWAVTFSRSPLAPGVKGD